ncbi:uncharacterized protein LOC142974884 [Anticarsia gemmatalis]|uniref:uncharacterized protein LOC142974884 n=1 Tax=Anticarsia gemmatalis TaxID=129554 RepID=UPI003F768414
MNLTPIKYLLYLQNFTCVFRNFRSYKLCGRVLISIWATLDTISILCNMVISAISDDLLELKAQTIYFFSVTGFSVALIILALYHSKTFHHLLRNFDTYHSLFADSIYSDNLLKAQKTITTFVVLFCSTKIAAYVYAQREMNQNVMMPERKFATFYMFNVIVCDYRYLFEFFLLHGILYVIAEQVNVITRSIDNELLRTSTKEHNDGVNETVVAVREDRQKKFEMWITAYKNISYNSKLCNYIFSTQLTIMLLILTIYFIMLLYSLTTMTAEDDGKPTILLFVNGFTMLTFLIAMYVISRAGQRVLDSSMMLIRKLCELYVHVLDSKYYEKHYKLTKDLLRCCYTHPVNINVMGSLNVNMSLLPSCVAFFTTYTVIALQFNNVL